MQILEIIGLFAGLALAAALSLVVLLRSAEALSWRHDDTGRPDAVAEPEADVAVPAQRTASPTAVSHRTIAAG
jgi:hypothetical protein